MPPNAALKHPGSIRDREADHQTPETDTVLRARAAMKGSFPASGVMEVTPRESTNLFDDPKKLIDPKKLDLALQIAEATYKSHVSKLEARGILSGGELLLMDRVVIEGRLVESVPIMPFAKLADKIRLDEDVQRALAALQSDRHGNVVILPDLRGASLAKLLQLPEIGIPRYFHNSDVTCELFPFHPEMAQIKDREERRNAFLRFKKHSLLRLGQLTSGGMLRVSFIDAEVTEGTLGMSLFETTDKARNLGLHVISPEAFIALQKIGKIDPLDENLTWLGGYNVPTGLGLCSGWDQATGKLCLKMVNPYRQDIYRGARREARISLLRGLE